jgi:hypothetical protein
MSARTGPGRYLLGVGSPNGTGDPPTGKVRGNVGDLHQSVDANAATLYVKDTTTTGWTPR